MGKGLGNVESSSPSKIYRVRHVNGGKMKKEKKKERKIIILKIKELE